METKHPALKSSISDVENLLMNTASKLGPHTHTHTHSLTHTLGTQTPDLGSAILLVGDGGTHINKANVGRLW